MASKDSGTLKWGYAYHLGEYTFRVGRSSGTSPEYDKIEASCTTKDGKSARKSIQVPSYTKIDTWYVEANETEATVYIVIKGDDIPIVPHATTGATLYQGGVVKTWSFASGDGELTFALSGKTRILLAASDTRDAVVVGNTPGQHAPDRVVCSSSYTHNGKTVYYATNSMTSPSGYVYVTPQADSIHPSNKVAWGMIYGGGTEETIGMMVGRFAIDQEDAGGVGPGSDWTDPGDYDEDWEEGDPTYTLYAKVIGALSGRHNDPIEDPSYSYIPTDKTTVKEYGCGGDGGHGGGGGAGAATVVVYKFATNQANSKEVTAIAKRHGYGSGGGKGGKGGDGCILVYY